MIKIIIQGKQGAGKNIIANSLSYHLKCNGFDAFVDNDLMPHLKPIDLSVLKDKFPNLKISIETEQTND